MSHQIDSFWSDARARLGADVQMEAPPAWSFGDSAELANELLALVLDGRKTATCGALWQYEAEGEAIPEVGDLSIILDGAGEPRCVVETTEIRIMPLNGVDEQFAFDEGEGDRSWEYWYEAHQDFFSRTLPSINREFTPTMPVVLERFRVRYP